MEMSLARADGAFARLEARLSVFGVGVVCAFGLLCAALVSITPSNSTFSVNPRNSHAAGYAYLSENPFDTGHELYGRVITPFIAHYLGLTGERWIYVPLIVGVLFLALVYRYVRGEGAAPTLSLAMAAMVAFSGAITTTLHIGGFPDTTSYVCLVWSLVLIRTAFWGLPFAVALLNHETGLMFLPMFLALSFVATRSLPRRLWVVRTVVPAASALLIFAGWRYAIRGTGAYSATGTYVNAINVTAFVNNVLNIPVGMFMALKLFWVIPLFALLISIAKRSFTAAFIIMSVLLGIAGAVLLASDTSRLASYGFMIAVYGVLVLRSYVGDRPLNEGLWYLIAANLFVPTYHVWSASWSLSPPAPIGYVLTQYGVSYFRDGTNVVPIFEPEFRDVPLEHLSKLAPEGAAWNRPGAAVLSSPLRISLGDGRRVQSIRLQADGNDTYLVRLYRYNQEIMRVEAPRARAGGLRSRDLDLGSVEVDQLIVVPGDGDGSFSVNALILR